MHPTEGLWRNWGQNVKTEREGQGLTQSELAIAAGLTIGRISAIERGVSSGNDQTKWEIARALGKEVADLFAYPSTKQTAEAA